MINLLAKTAEVNCQMRSPVEHSGDSFGLEVLRVHLEIMCEIYFRYKEFQENPATRQESWKQMQLLHSWFARENSGQITFGDSFDEESSAKVHCGSCHAEIFVANPAINGRCKFCHNKAEKPHDVPRFFIEKTWTGSGNTPRPFPKNRDITGSPPVRTTFEPLRKKDTAVFQEEMESISAFQLGERIVSKRYQFNGVHMSYLHSKLIVTETPEEILEKPILDDEIEYVEVIDDPSTWIGNAAHAHEKQVGSNIDRLINKFNKRRHA